MRNYNNIVKNIIFKEVDRTPQVRKYEKFMKEILNKKLNEEGVIGKIQESIALGLPWFINSDGKIEVVNPYIEKESGDE